MRRLTTFLVPAFTVLAFISQPVRADDMGAILKRVQELYDQKNYSKAIEELSWAQKELEKAKSKVTEGLFPEEVLGFKGGKIEGGAAFGFSNMERTYTKGDQSIKVSLTETKGAGQNPLGGLAAFGQMAAMMGNQPGMDTFRMDGRTATLESQDESASLTVFLSGGSMMKFELSGGNDSAKLKEFAGQFKIAEFEKGA